jgi:hypothetical protein
MKRDLTAWLQAGTLALSAWILFEVHNLRVDLEVLRTEQVELERRIHHIEDYGR